MKWKITFFNDKVEAQTLKLPTGILANFLHITEMIENMGPNLGKPYVGRLGACPRMEARLREIHFSVDLSIV